jgi:hypothetical protein
MKSAPNFLTCPAVPELPAPRSQEPGQLPRPPQSQGTETERGKGRRGGWIKMGIIVLVVLGISAVFVPPAVALGKAALAAQTARQALDSLKVRLENGDFVAASAETIRAKQALDDFSQALQGVGFFRDAPFVGAQVKALQEVAVVGSHTLDGLNDLLDVAVSLSEAVSAGSQNAGPDIGQVGPTKGWQDLSREEKRNLLRALNQALPDIRLARDKIDMALALWDGIPKDRIPTSIYKALQPMVKALPIMRQAMDQSVPLLETLVPLAGYPESKKYLVILQNSDELRPSGGFIGGVVSLVLDGGELRDFTFSDVYNIDNPVSAVWKEVPPAPLAKNLGVKAWFMRDANWSPDFAVSADKVMDFYTREYALQGKDERPDGVIALEPELFKGLLRLTGPITIRGKTYTDQTFMDLLEYEVEIGFLQQGAKVEDRKDVMAELGAELAKKIQAVPRSDWPRLLDLLTVALRQKQVMVYTHDATLQALLDRRGWSGRAKATTCDFLWVVDANLAALKTDGMMIKTSRYALDASDPKKPTAKLTLDYENTTPKISWRYTRYRSYTRLYVPEGSQLMSAQGVMQGDLTQTGGKFVPGKVDVMKELGKTVFGAFWAIEPGRKGQLSFTYALPTSTADCLMQNNYHLDWAKQPGTDGTEVDVKVIFPRTVTAAEPPEDKAKWGDAIYEAQSYLQEDRTFEAKY